MAFHFKEFSVDDSACAMKVGTDSVLLGAWADFAGCARVLDIGTGCGLLALMAAQKSNAAITAIDIDVDSCHQAEKNFSESPWSDRLQCIAQGLDDFTVSRLASRGETYDHIITNPPYFINSLKSPDNGRNTARHTDDLPLTSLLEFSYMLLSDSGKMSMVFPYSDSRLLISLAAEQGLNPVRQCLIIPKEGKEPNRILLEFQKGKVESQDTSASMEEQDTLAFRAEQSTPASRTEQSSSGNSEVQVTLGSRDVHTTLTIRDSHGKYTQEYIDLTDRFYLKLS